jgi:amino acid transporter
MRRVNPHTRTPIPATILIVVVGCVLMGALPGGALLEMLTVGGLIGAVLYGAIIVLYLVVRKRLGHQKDAFDLGRFDVPVAIGALAWSAVVVFVLVSPSQALTAALISVGVVLVGGMYLAYLMIFNREVMETEPGEVDVFKH